MFSYKIQSYQEDGSLDVVPFLEGNGLYLTLDFSTCLLVK